LHGIIDDKAPRTSGEATSAIDVKEFSMKQKHYEARPDAVRPEDEHGFGIATSVHPNDHDVGQPNYRFGNPPPGTAIARNFFRISFILWLFLGLIALMMIVALVSSQTHAPEVDSDGYQRPTPISAPKD
jgi:hypothetical protein